jgi:hypothetical protein
MQPMAKAPTRSTVADPKPLQSTPNDWMPLTDAFQHIQQSVGGEQLAEEDLRLRLELGDVEAQERRVTPGGGIDIILLTSEDFRDGLLFPRLPEHIGSLHREAHLRDNLLRRVDRYRSAGHNFFLRRTDVYRIWPIVGAAEEPRQAALPAIPPKGIGPKAWLAAQEVYKLRREGGKWINIENDLLSQIRERLGGDEWLSNSTLKTALAYLKKNGLIDL